MFKQKPRIKMENKNYMCKVVYRWYLHNIFAGIHNTISKNNNSFYLTF